MAQPKVSIIILNYNGVEDTIECLESLSKITYPNYEVILIDNNSAGNDVEKLRNMYGGSIRIIRNELNYGFTGGNNIGIIYALENSNPDYILLLNNDTIVAPDYLTELVKVASSGPTVGAVVAKIYLYNKPHHIESTGLKINMWCGQSYRLHWRRMDKGQYDEVTEVNAASTNAFLIPADVLQKVGLFDEGFFIYHDDADWCLRARKAGYKILYAPKAKIWHKVGSATRKTTGLAYYYLARNNFKFMRKHATRKQYQGFILYYFTVHMWLMTAAYMAYFHLNLKIVWCYYKGVWHGLRGVK